MKNNLLCPLCQSNLEKLDDVYDSCFSCGLNLKREFFSTEITNDHLDYQEIVKIDSLTKFKIRMVEEIDETRQGLLDVGSASGKFIYHARNLYQSIQGIEINERCIEFAKNELHVKLVASLSEVDLKKVSMVTFWHSLEHIPLEVSRKMLSELKTGTNSKILISVPNASSLQFRIFGSFWPYYDKSSHLYQFSPQALNLLFTQSGFEMISRKVGFMYELFGWLQGGINRLHPVPNYFYYRKKRGWDYGFSKSKLFILDFYNYMLLAALLPIAFAASFLSYFKNEGVINYVYIRC